MKSVCIITETHSFGGVENHTLALMGALIAHGYSIELIANRHHEYDQRVVSRGWKDKITILHTTLGGICDDDNDASHWRQLFKGLHSQILIFPKGDFSYGRMSFLRECRRRFGKIIFIEHLEPYPRPRKRSRLWLGFIPGIGFRRHRDQLLRKAKSLFYADRIIAVSDKVKARLVGDWGYSPLRISVVHNGVDWRAFVRNEECGRAVRHRYQIPQDAFVFGMMARLNQEKGIDVALRALRLLLDQSPKRAACLVIAGTGPLDGELKSLAAELGLGPQHVKFIGFVEDPHEALCAYDAIVFSSRLEGLPLGLLEGMAAGCLPIVTRVSGMPEAVDSPTIGWVVAPEDPQELCDAMGEALELDHSNHQEMAARGLLRIQTRFDIAQSHRKILEICGL